MPKLNLAALLEQGLTLDDVVARLGPDVDAGAWDETWRRCALLRFFDRQSYSEAVKDIAAPSFAAFREAPHVYAIDASSFAVSPTKRVELLKSWRADTTALIAFSKRMFEYFQSRQDEVSAFSQQLLFDGNGANQSFITLYLAADARFDIPACSLLLEIIRTRYELLPPAVQQTWARFDEYLRSRTMFADDYYRSASYLERHKLAKAFDDFWANPAHWLLRIYGKGGSGKTMFVRWLVARRCLPRIPGRDPIAVARIDFDFLNLSSFARRPWLVLLPIARQLSPQLARNPFASIVGELDDFTLVLQHAENPRPEIAAALDSRKAWAVSSFETQLGTDAALIVLDTCEEPLIHRKAEFKILLQTLADIRAKTCPNLRVIVSGRYDVSANGRLPAFDKGTASVEVNPFDIPEAKRYLVEKRHMDPGALVNAIARKSGGSPFSLGLFADLAAYPPGLTAKAVREAPQDEFIYLLDRVILRIQQESVRWLVRYAVIPRELTFDFAAKVLSRLLSDPSSDNANQFTGDLAKRYASQTPWPKARIGLMKKIWDDLVKYASNPSWIVWNPEAKTLKLQSEVVVPMRKLLQEQGPLYASLHRDAEKYWRERARLHPAEFCQCMAEALFHRFHRLGDGASDEWRKLLKNAKVKTAEDRTILGEMILDKSFLDENGNPRDHFDGGPIVNADTVLQARFLIAEAVLSERLKVGRRFVDGDIFIQKLSEQWNSIQKRSGTLDKAVTKSEFVLVQAACVYLLNRRLPLLRRIRAARLPDTLRLLARMLASRVSYERTFLNLPTDDSDFVQALELSSRLKSTEFPAGHIQFRSGLFYLRKAELPAAANAFQIALVKSPGIGPFAPERPESVWRIVLIARMRGRWKEALQFIETLNRGLKKNDPEYVSLTFQYWHSRAAINMDLGDMKEAMRCLEQAQPFAGHDYSLAANHELAGEIATRCLDYRAAEGHFNSALSAYGDSGGLGASRVRICQAALFAAMGDSRSARSRLPTPPAYWQLALEAEAVRIRAGAQIKSLARKKIGPSELRAQALALELAHSRTKLPARFFAELKTLDDQAKFFALMPFAESSDSGRLQPIAKTLLPKPPVRANNPAYVVQALALADARRFFGDAEGAAELLAQLPTQPPYLEWRRLRAIHAVDPQTPFDVETFLTAFLGEFAAYSFLCAVVQIEVAEWCAGWEDFRTPARLLPSIEEALKTRTITASTWVAAKSRIEALIAQHQQDTKRARSHFQLAAEVAGNAGAVKMKLGAERSVRLLDRLATSKTPDRILIPEVDEWTFDFTKKPVEFEVRFKLKGRGGGRFVHKSPTWLTPALEPLMSVPDWVPMLRELAATASPFNQHFRPEANRLRLSSGTFAALPWELLAPAGANRFYRSCEMDAAVPETARWMQVALKLLGYPLAVSDRAGDPQFLAALQAFHPETDRSPHAKLRAALTKRRMDPIIPAVVIVQPDRERQYSTKRGYHLESIDLHEAYDPSLRPMSFREVVNGVNVMPSVFHFAGTFRQSPSGEVTLDAGLEAPLTVSRLASLLIDAPVESIRPFLVVDAFAATKEEANRQALLRNVFCAQLFERSVARAILGFGLMPRGQTWSALGSLGRASSERLSLGELNRDLLNNRKLFFVPPALWCDDPELPAIRS